MIFKKIIKMNGKLLHWTLCMNISLTMTFYWYCCATDLGVYYLIYLTFPHWFTGSTSPCLWALEGSHSTSWGIENEKIMTLIHCKSSTWCRKKGAEVNSGNRLKWKCRVTPFSTFGRSICKLLFFCTFPKLSSFFLSFQSCANYYSPIGGYLQNRVGSWWILLETVDSHMREFNCVWIKYSSVSAEIILTLIKRPVR